MGSRCLVRRSGGFKIIGSFRFKNKSFHYKANTTIFCIAFKDLKCGNSYTSVLNSSRASLEISCCKNFLTATSYTEEQIAMMQKKQYKDGNGRHFLLFVHRVKQMSSV